MDEDPLKNNIKEYIGPGYWAAIHIEAHSATTHDEKIKAANIISSLLLNFCRFDIEDKSSKNL